eukprot:scaffold106773_cov20-Tisochrysis_lutea.AAC.5
MQPCCPACRVELQPLCVPHPHNELAGVALWPCFSASCGDAVGTVPRKLCCTLAFLACILGLSTSTAAYGAHLKRLQSYPHMGSDIVKCPLWLLGKDRPSASGRCQGCLPYPLQSGAAMVFRQGGCAWMLLGLSAPTGDHGAAMVAAGLIRLPLVLSGLSAMPSPYM